nr:MAG TPA: hypothetical protein [Caudoviricetes sp.]
MSKNIKNIEQTFSETAWYDVFEMPVIPLEHDLQSCSCLI